MGGVFFITLTMRKINFHKNEIEHVSPPPLSHYTRSITATHFSRGNNFLVISKLLKSSASYHRAVGLCRFILVHLGSSRSSFLDHGTLIDQRKRAGGV